MRSVLEQSNFTDMEQVKALLDSPIVGDSSADEILKKHGIAWINSVVIDGKFTCLTYLAHKKKFRACEVFVKKLGADPNIIDWSELHVFGTGRGRHLLCYCEYLEQAVQMMKLGADPFTRIATRGGGPGPVFYAFHYLLNKNYLDTCFEILKTAKKPLPPTTPGYGFFRYIDPGYTHAIELIDRLCDLGCIDGVYESGDSRMTLLARACLDTDEFDFTKGRLPTALRIVDTLCAKQRYEAGEGPDMILSLDASGPTLLERVLALWRFALLPPLVKVSKIGYRTSGHVSEEFYPDTFVKAVKTAMLDRVGGRDGYVPADAKELGDCFEWAFFSTEDPEMLQRLYEMAPAEERKAVFFEGRRTLRDWTSQAIISQRPGVWRFFFALDICDFSMMMIGDIMVENPLVEYSAMEQLLAKSREIKQQDEARDYDEEDDGTTYPDALRACELFDVSHVLEAERYDVVFLLLKYEKIQPFRWRGRSLVTRNENNVQIVVNETFEDNEESRPEYPIREYIFRETLEWAYEISEEYKAARENSDWFQLNFGWWAAKKKAIEQRLRQPALDPVTMKIVLDYALKIRNNWERPLDW